MYRTTDRNLPAPCSPWRHEKELLGQQAVRIAFAFARHCRVQEADAEDISISFMHGKFLPNDLFHEAWKGEDEKRLEHMAEIYIRGWLYRQRKGARKLVSLFGRDGTEAGGPAGQLVAREPGPEELLLRKQIREYVAKALDSLTAQQVELFMFVYDQEERVVDFQQAAGLSPQALWKARSRMRERLRCLLIAAGLDEAMAADFLNELDRMRSL